MNLSWGADPPAVWPAHGGGARGPVAVREDEAVPPASTLHHRLADELAPMVEVWERLLATHQPDRSGRCRTCTQGGTGLPGTHWPCALHGLADLARRRHRLAEGA